MVRRLKMAGQGIEVLAIQALPSEFDPWKGKVDEKNPLQNCSMSSTYVLIHACIYIYNINNNF